MSDVNGKAECVSQPDSFVWKQELFRFANFLLKCSSPLWTSTTSAASECGGAGGGKDGAVNIETAENEHLIPWKNFWYSLVFLLLIF